MQYKGILFDADGVIINSQPLSQTYIKEYNINNEDMLPFFKGDFQECMAGKADLLEKIQPWLERWNWKGSARDFLDYWFNTEDNADNRLLEIVKDMRKKGVVCCLATNQERYRTRYIRKNMGFEKIFDRVYSSCEIGYKKPDKRFFSHILKDLDNGYRIYPRDLVLFDDSQENVDAANEAGINAFLYNGYDSIEKALNLSKH